MYTYRRNDVCVPIGVSNDSLLPKQYGVIYTYRRKGVSKGVCVPLSVNNDSAPKGCSVIYAYKRVNNDSVPIGVNNDSVPISVNNDNRLQRIRFNF
ncbi:hypothetical protein CEXT_232111 [Caerostris extrusa]|uniref:Uncharacterized protein n=1 Tax=Caerostris extrusa TaxID=172846 RepID=A0AAV4V559_CAEEX|nr:hypothetical protein CEXT_232111 [Caerostris extrusa]